MRSSSPISLFSAPTRKEGQPSAFVVSIVLHSLVFGMMFLTVHHVSVVEQRPLDLDSVRLLNVRPMDAAMRWVPQHSLKSKGARAARHSIFQGGKHGSAVITRTASIPRSFKPQIAASQTLIQPDIPPTTRVLPEIAIPQVMVWTAGVVTQQKIVPPTPQPAGAIQVHPTLAKPNLELTPAEVSLSSTPFTTNAPLPAPGTAMPINVSGPQPAKQMPQTASADKGPISPARVISLSNLKLQTGTAALPAINEIAPADSAGLLTPGDAETVSQASGSAGTGTSSIQNGSGAGHAAGDGGDNGQGAAAENGSGAEADDNGSDAGASGPGFTVFSGSGSNADEAGSAAPEHIVQPKGGQYGMVVVGASPEEDYPETANLWTGRMVYTVYLQTDTPQNWILQYSLPRTHEDPPGDRLDAPWPFDMMRPNLGKYDMVLVHGFVNEEGRFEQLAVAYPPRFGKSEMLLRNLKQWIFRPAMLNGQPTSVEVLLIIPGAAE